MLSKKNPCTYSPLNFEFSLLKYKSSNKRGPRPFVKTNKILSIFHGFETIKPVQFRHMSSLHRIFFISIVSLIRIKKPIFSIFFKNRFNRIVDVCKCIQYEKRVRPGGGRNYATFLTDIAGEPGMPDGGTTVELSRLMAPRAAYCVPASAALLNRGKRPDSHTTPVT